jgi:hypothetical protein
LPLASARPPTRWLAAAAHYWSPLPHLQLQALAWPGHAALDISDGLLADCGHIAKASGVALQVNRRSAVSLLRGLSSARAALRAALSGGDDYVLAFTAARGGPATLDAGVHVIGHVLEGQGVTLRDPQARTSPRNSGAINISGRHRDRSPQSGACGVRSAVGLAQPVALHRVRLRLRHLAQGPGTWGSLVALPFIPLWQMLPDWGYWLMLGISMLFGFWLCGKVANDLRVHDHEGIVWDEMVGMWITLWLVPEGWQWLLQGS